MDPETAFETLHGGHSGLQSKLLIESNVLRCDERACALHNKTTTVTKMNRKLARKN
jgi:hypothetical protein